MRAIEIMEIVPRIQAARRANIAAGVSWGVIDLSVFDCSACKMRGPFCGLAFHKLTCSVFAILAEKVFTRLAKGARVGNAVAVCAYGAERLFQAVGPAFPCRVFVLVQEFQYHIGFWFSLWFPDWVYLAS